MRVLTPGPSSVCPFDPAHIRKGLSLVEARLAFANAAHSVRCGVATGLRPGGPIADRLADTWAEKSRRVGFLLMSFSR